MNCNSRVFMPALVLATILGGHAPQVLAQADGGGQAAPEAAAEARNSVVLTIDTAIARAQTDQARVRRAEAEVRAAQEKIGMAESGYYPSVSGTAAYTRVEPEQSFTFPGLGTFSLSQVDNWNLQLGVSQVVYDSGRRGLQVEAARGAARVARNALDQAKRDLAFQAAQAFCSALFLREEVASLDGQLDDLKEHLAVVERKEQTGSATRYEILNTQVQVATLQSRRIEASRQYEKAKVALAKLVGLDPTADIALEGELRPRRETIDPGSLVIRALSSRPELRQAAESEEAARLNLSLASAGALPTLLARADAGYANGLLPDENALTFNWDIGFTLNVPLFNGFLIVHQAAAARAELEAAEDDGAALRSDIAAQTLQAAKDLAADRELEGTSTVQVDQARQALDAAKIQYEGGIITNDEYLSAQTALEQAEFANLMARYNEVMSEYALEQAIGAQPGEQ